jgi:putative nucleotidyltransferase with HDIG domain
MTGKSPEWVNLMLDAVDPPALAVPAALEKMTKRARAIATKRTRHLGQPDAHALRVATLAAEIARRLGFCRHEIDTVVEGALLHDLGKTRVPRAILDQNRPLTEEEYATVMKHPVWGAALVDGFVADGALLAIRHHHEWWNGNGYPAQLAGHDIPIEARIVGIADAFAAMREERPYRPARSRQAAVGELQQGAGTQFDPQLVDPLIAGVVAEDCPPLRLVAH